MQVIIGVDPHKASHTAVAISAAEEELAYKRVRASQVQVDKLLAWAEPFPTRVWAVEGADGMGYLLAQQLVATGEHVLNVPATLAARTRLLGTGRSNKNDPNDALSIAVTALRARDLRPVQAVGHSEVLRLLAKRNRDIGDHRTRLVCRMHALLLELSAGGIAKEINAADVDRFLAEVRPTTPAQKVRYDLAVELLDDIRRQLEKLLLDAIPQDPRSAQWVTGPMCGLRPGEFAGLWWPNVEIDGNDPHLHVVGRSTDVDMPASVAPPVPGFAQGW